MRDHNENGLVKSSNQEASLALRTLLFFVGLTLPAISFRTGAGGVAAGFLGRVAPVDMLVLLFIIILLFSNKFKIHHSMWLYMFALILSLIIGFAHLICPVSDIGPILVAFSALCMALLYWVLGYSVGRSSALVRALILGIALGAAWEFLVVAHDFFFSPQWFAGRRSGFVRGTFRKSGQLGNYGFTTAGILLAMGWATFPRRSERVCIYLAGIICIFFSVAATRRSAIIAVALWLMFFLVVGLRHALTRHYISVLAVVIILIGFFIVFYSEFSGTFVAQRFSQGLDKLSTGETLILTQPLQALDRIGEWFPFGVGVGRGKNITGRHEFHNGHLALIIEMGVLGILAFYWLLWIPLFRRVDGKGLQATIVKTLVISFILAAMAFMVHNRLHRDRQFMLFLGLASSYCVGATGNRKSTCKLSSQDSIPVTRESDEEHNNVS